MIDNSSTPNFSDSSTQSAPIKGPLLLHVCCAPCACGIIETLLQESIKPVLFFYNPNIYPWQEYERRKAAVMAFAQKQELTVIDADYDNQSWRQRVQGLENEPERGARCSACFDMRMERTALYAHEQGFPIFSTTNGISRHKDVDQVNYSGLKAALRYPPLMFLTRNWRKQGALQRADEIIKKESIYRQMYCGCEFSLKQTNDRRHSQGLSPLETDA